MLASTFTGRPIFDFLISIFQFVIPTGAPRLLRHEAEDRGNISPAIKSFNRVGILLQIHPPR
jgi:hypothetical protein